jgi:protein-S-isoprenylcysteine O-methyltransferase Ste14
MPGRQLFRWSPLTWVGLTFVSASMGALVVASSPSFPLAWAIGACLTFAAIATAVWAWITLVEPQAVAPGREVR